MGEHEQAAAVPRGIKRFSLEGKVALITGGSRGLGRAIALGFAAAGADVAIAARSEGDLATVAKEIEAIGVHSLPVSADVTDKAQVDAMVDKTVEGLGHLDVLVNNAGGGRMRPLMVLRPEGWERDIALNLTSVFYATQAGARAMSEGEGGSIIQISSVSTEIGTVGLSAYAAAKGGVRAMMLTAAKELAEKHIRINAISPGWIETDLNALIRQNEQLRSYIESIIPMRRFGLPDEVVGAAIFLASDASSFMTGTTLMVDGGQTA